MVIQSIAYSIAVILVLYAVAYALHHYVPLWVRRRKERDAELDEHEERIS